MMELMLKTNECQQANFAVGRVCLCVVCKHWHYNRRVKTDSLKVNTWYFVRQHTESANRKRVMCVSECFVCNYSHRCKIVRKVQGYVARWQAQITVDASYWNTKLTGNSNSKNNNISENKRELLCVINIYASFGNIQHNVPKRGRKQLARGTWDQEDDKEENGREVAEETEVRACVSLEDAKR